MTGYWNLIVTLYASCVWAVQSLIFGVPLFLQTAWAGRLAK